MSSKLRGVHVFSACLCHYPNVDASSSCAGKWVARRGSECFGEESRISASQSTTYDITEELQVDDGLIATASTLHP